MSPNKQGSSSINFLLEHQNKNAFLTTDKFSKL